MKNMQDSRDLNKSPVKYIDQDQSVGTRVFHKSPIEF